MFEIYETGCSISTMAIVCSSPLLNTNIQNVYRELTREMSTNSMRYYQERLDVVVKSNGAETEL